MMQSYKIYHKATWASILLVMSGLAMSGGGGIDSWHKYSGQARYEPRHHFYDNPLLQAYSGEQKMVLNQHRYQYSSPKSMTLMLEAKALSQRLQQIVTPYYPNVQISYRSSNPSNSSNSNTASEFWHIQHGRGVQKRWQLILYGACISNTPAAVYALTQAAAESSLAPSLLYQLVQARVQVLLSCDKPNGLLNYSAAVAALDAQPAGQLWSQYLQASKALYVDSDYHQALEHIQNLLTLNQQNKAIAMPENAWLIETSRYLLGRFALLRAQENWNGYSYSSGATLPAGIEQAWVDQAERYFSAYQAQYPDGRYVNSARGFQQRMAMFRGQDMAAATMQIIQQVPTEQTAERLKIFKRMLSDIRSRPGTLSALNENSPEAQPLYLAYLLKRYPEKLAPLVIDLFENRLTPTYKNQFVGYPGLFEALQIEANYRLGNYQAVVAAQMPQVYPKLLDSQVKQRQAESYLALQQPAKAREIWLQMRANWQATTGAELLKGMSEQQKKRWYPEYQYPPKIYRVRVTQSPYEIDLAATYVQEQNYLGLARAISSPVILDEVLNQLCDNDLLLSIANDTTLPAAAQNEAREALFMNNIKQAEFAWLSQNFRRIAKHDYFAEIETAIGRLSVAPDDMVASSKLATYLLHNHYLQPQGRMDERLRPPINPCDASKNYGTRHYFAKVIAAHHEVTDNNGNVVKPRSMQEAKALHYFAVSANRYGRLSLTGNTPALVPSSKASFLRLYKRYPNSEWTKMTPYYYDNEVVWSAYPANQPATDYQSYDPYKYSEWPHWPHHKH